MVVVGQDNICPGLQLRHGVAHGEAQARAVEHGQVVGAVADAGDLLPGNAQLLRQHGQRRALGGAAVADLHIPPAEGQAARREIRQRRLHPRTCAPAQEEQLQLLHAGMLRLQQRGQGRYRAGTGRVLAVDQPAHGRQRVALQEKLVVHMGGQSHAGAVAGGQDAERPVPGHQAGVQGFPGAGVGDPRAVGADHIAIIGTIHQLMGQARQRPAGGGDDLHAPRRRIG